MEKNEELLAYFRNPSNVGVLESNHQTVRTGLVGIPEGDLVQLQMIVENAQISKTAFLAYGAASTIAAASLATEFLKGLSVDNILIISAEMLQKKLNLNNEQLYSALLVENAIQEAVPEYYRGASQ